MTEYQKDLESIKGSPGGLIPDGHFKTLSPLLLLHIRRLYVTGTTTDPEEIATEVRKLDGRVNRKEVLRFVNENIIGEEWNEERNKYLQAQYDRMLADEEALSTHVDNTYDRIFSRLREYTEARVDALAKSANGEGLPMGILKEATKIFKDLFEMQRLARNMATSKKTVEERSASIVIDGKAEEFLKRIEANVVATTVLEPVS